MKKKGYKKWLAVSLSAAMLAGNLNGFQMVKAADVDVVGYNLVDNAEFTEMSDWEFEYYGGYGTNNGYPSGTQHFYLNGGSYNVVKQFIKIPADGQYKASAWISNGGSGAKFGVRMADGTVVKSVDITTGSAYTQYSLEEMELKRGDEVEIYVSGSTQWVNGDMFNLSCTRQDGKADDPTSEVPKYIFEGNMVVNPSFAENKAWNLSSAGYASNNGHNGNGDKHFYINASYGKLTQQVQVPYTGYYKVGLWVASAGAGAKFGATNITTGNTEVVELATNTAYTEYVMEIWANKDDVIEVYVSGGSNWVNGDDISIEYNLSRFENMVVDPTLSSEDAWVKEDNSVSQKIYIPQDGPYYAEVTLENADGAVVSFAGVESEAITGSKTIRVEASDLKMADLVELKVTGTATVKNAVVEFDLAKIPNEAPTATDIIVTGDYTGGLVIEGSYKFNDADGHTEGNSVYQWLIADEADGTYTTIEGETSKNLTVKEEWEDKYLKFQVTPVDQYEKAGGATSSSAIGPVDVNLIQDPGFESDAVGWSGISISNKDAYAGLVRGIVKASSTASQSITVPRSAYYDFAAYVRYSGTNAGVISIQDEAGNEMDETGANYTE